MVDQLEKSLVIVSAAAKRFGLDFHMFVRAVIGASTVSHEYRFIGHMDNDDETQRWLDESEPQTSEELIDLVRQQKLTLRRRADDEISKRQDIVDMGIATAADIASLSEWEKYRASLIRVDTSVVWRIVWPRIPE